MFLNRFFIENLYSSQNYSSPCYYSLILLVVTSTRTKMKVASNTPQHKICNLPYLDSENNLIDIDYASYDNIDTNQVR